MEFAEQMGSRDPSGRAARGLQHIRPQNDGAGITRGRLEPADCLQEALVTKCPRVETCKAGPQALRTPGLNARPGPRTS